MTINISGTKRRASRRSNAGSVDIARSALHTLLIHRDGLDSDGGFSLPLNLILVSELINFFRVWTF